MSGPYDDIIDLPHHISHTRPQMSRQARAAQFAPFAALTGYEAALREEGRLTEREQPLSEEERTALDRCLQMLLTRLEAGERPRVTVTRFVPDLKKEGGSYQTSIETLRRIDLIARLMHTTDGPTLEIDRISELEYIPDHHRPES